MTPRASLQPLTKNIDQHEVIKCTIIEGKMNTSTGNAAAEETESAGESVVSSFTASLFEMLSTSNKE